MYPGFFAFFIDRLGIVVYTIYMTKGNQRGYIMYDITDLYTFISTGEKTAMYTLRVMCEVRHPQGAYLKDYFVRNLSTDKKTANEKAHYFSDEMGVPLKSDATFDLNEIKRRKAEEIAADREEQERVERQRIEDINMKTVEALECDVFLVGKYTGETPHEVAIAHEDIDYLKWFARQASDINDGYFDKFNISANIAKNWIDENPQSESEYVGEEGEKRKFKVRINMVRTIDAFRSVTYLFEMNDEEGNIIKTFSKAKGMMNAPKKEWITIEATVKKHEMSVYDDYQKVTIVNRPKVV